MLTKVSQVFQVFLVFQVFPGVQVLTAVGQVQLSSKKLSLNFSLSIRLAGEAFTTMKTRTEKVICGYQLISCPDTIVLEDAESHLVRVSKLSTISAMKRPNKPKIPPLAPATAVHRFSKAALKKLPAAATTPCGLHAGQVKQGMEDRLSMVMSATSSA